MFSCRSSLGSVATHDIISGVYYQLMGAILGIIYDDYDGLGDDKPFSDDDTYRAYHLFSQYAAEKKIRVLIGKPEDYRDGGLDAAWDLILGEKVGRTGIDACWDRQCKLESAADFARMQKLREEIAERMPFVNHPRLSFLASDKYEAYRAFPDLIPQTFLASELEEARRTFSGRVVTKPRFGAHGRGVEIRDIAEIDSLPEDFIVQRFVDSTAGIPGLTEGAHDLRLVLVNDVIADTYIRFSKSGLISNVSRGGTMKMLDTDALPASVVSVARRVDAHFSAFVPRIYSIDFMIEGGERPWVGEFNYAPGIWGHMVQGVPLDVFKKFCMQFVSALAGTLETN